MAVVLTGRFVKAYRRLGAQDQDRVKRALALLEADPGHPSLHVEVVRGTKGRGSEIRSMRASDAIRITFEVLDGDYYLRNVGGHQVYRAP